MEIGGYGYEKPELLKIAEQLYACKGRKQDLELELDSEQFHQKYIPKRKKLMTEQVFSHLPVIIILTLVVSASIIAFVIAILDGGEGVQGNVMLIGYGMCLIFGGYADYKFILHEIHMIKLLRISTNKEKAIAYARKHDINTFQSDAAISKEKISLLEQEIAALDEEIASLTAQQQKILDEQKSREDILRKKGVLFDQKPQQTDDGDLPEKKQTGKFSLKEESVGTQDAFRLHEFYSHEEQYINNYLLKLDGKLQRINKEITDIDDDFENVKKQLFFAVIIYLLIALIQSAFSGILSVVTSVLCIILSVVYILHFEGKCKRSILLYLVEHDSNLTKEYAFCNNMVPVRNKREELLQTIENYQKELAEIKKKKAEIVF